MSLLFACLLASSLATQARAAEPFLLDQVWLQAPTQFRVSEKVKILADVSPRFGFKDVGLNQFLVRTGLQYQPRKSVSYAIGFDTVDNYLPTRSHENRLWQQLQLQRRYRQLTLSARWRLEERYFTDKPGLSLRPRIMLKASHQLGKSRFSLVGSNELFLTINNMADGPAPGVDRNRLFAGLAIAVDRKRSLEAGYRVEYINKTDVDDETRRQLVVQLASNF
jgi:hypothetical protein